METPLAASLAGVTRRFAKTRALDSVGFHVRRGEVVALLGPNGAGKTTLVCILLGLIRPTLGSVALWGLPPDAVAARRRVGVMLQVGRVPETLTVREHVHLFSSYYATPQPIHRTLERAGATAIAERRFGDLSGGERQRALFALAMVKGQKCYAGRCTRQFSPTPISSFANSSNRRGCRTRPSGTGNTFV